MPGRALGPAHNGPAFQLGRRLQTLATMACNRLLRWHELSRQRRALLRLNERMLKDIGITRLEAEREARRPFWSDGMDGGTAPAISSLRQRPAYGRLAETLIRRMLERRQTAVRRTRPLAAAADGERNADAKGQRQQK
jgi:uncharacterized protein YjiS (DUF1127 family)